MVAKMLRTGNSGLTLVYIFFKFSHNKVYYFTDICCKYNIKNVRVSTNGKSGAFHRLACTNSTSIVDYR